jgi:hypothetical protein
MLIPRSLLEEETSLEYWHKHVIELGIPSPKTIIISLTQTELEAAHNEQLLPTVTTKIRTAADTIGYPFFLRTDLSSGKHKWESSCYVVDPDKIDSHAYEVIVYNLLAGIYGLPFRSLVVREFVPLEGGKFTAFLGNFPVTKERRFFVRDGVVECHHEYWVEGAILQGMECKLMPEAVWRPLLEEVNSIDEHEVELLSEYARKIGSTLGGYWSVDFAKTADGQWLLIDMGRGEISYHKEGCEYNRPPKICPTCTTRISDLVFENHGKCRRCRNKTSTKKEVQKTERDHK